MDMELKDLDNRMHEELINGNENEPEEFKTLDRESCTSADEDENEISNGSCNDEQPPMFTLDETKLGEIKQEHENVEKSDNLKQDNQDAIDEEEVEEKNEEPDKIEEQKSSPGPENQEGSNEDNTTNLGRNRRVRQKNRYFLDFHCIDLTKGARSNREEYDIFTSSTSTRSSNRRSTTDTKGPQEEPDVFENRYCRKCSSKTPHDSANGCQACLYKKIVESVKRQKPSSQKNRSASSSKQQHSNEIESSASSQNTTNNNKRKANRQQDKTLLSKIIKERKLELFKNHRIETNNINTSANNVNTINTTSPESSGDIINDDIGKLSTDNNSGGNNEISSKLPRLDSWTPNEVAEYIISKGFANEAELFKTQSVDGISLLLMQRTDFTYGLKIKLGPALKIYDQVCKLKKEYFNNIATTSN